MRTKSNLMLNILSIIRVLDSYFLSSSKSKSCPWRPVANSKRPEYLLSSFRSMFQIQIKSQCLQWSSSRKSNSRKSSSRKSNSSNSSSSNSSSRKSSSRKSNSRKSNSRNSNSRNSNNSSNKQWEPFSPQTNPKSKTQQQKKNQPVLESNFNGKERIGHPKE